MTALKDYFPSFSDMVLCVKPAAGEDSEILAVSVCFPPFSDILLCLKPAAGENSEMTAGSDCFPSSSNIVLYLKGAAGEDNEMTAVSVCFPSSSNIGLYLKRAPGEDSGDEWDNYASGVDVGVQALKAAVNLEETRDGRFLFVMAGSRTGKTGILLDGTGPVLLKGPGGGLALAPLRGFLGLHSHQKFKHSVRRPLRLKSPILPERVPCLLSCSPDSEQSEFYFPISRQSYRVNFDLRQFIIAGQSIPGRDSWLILVRGRQVLLFNGRRFVETPLLLFKPRGRVMASFSGNPNLGVPRFLVLDITRRLCKVARYTPDWGWLVELRVMRHTQPMGHVTTSTGFYWVDAGAPVLYGFEDQWSGDDLSLMAAALDRDLVGGAEMISSVVDGERLYAMVVLRQGEFRVYLYGQRLMVNGRLTQPLLPYRLVPGQTMFASSTGPGLLRTVNNRVEPSQLIFLGSWGADCLQIDGGRGPANTQIVKQCYHRVNGVCLCRSCVLLVDEDSLRNEALLFH